MQEIVFFNLFKVGSISSDFTFLESFKKVSMSISSTFIPQRPMSFF